ncbi:MAG: GNAT family N-acetyltransferase [Planctomycetota bacterium]
MLVFFKRYRMQFDLRGISFEEPTVPDGYHLVPWTSALLNSHAEAKFKSFRDELDANVFPCLGHIDGCRKLMKEITRRKGFVPQATWLMIFQDAEGVNRPVATVQGIRNNPSIGLIQNIGVVDTFRGKGLGSIIVRRSLAGFQSVGAKTVTLEVTTKNLGAIRLYKRLGFKIQKTVYKSIDVESVF